MSLLTSTIEELSDRHCCILVYGTQCSVTGLTIDYALFPTVWNVADDVMGKNKPRLERYHRKGTMSQLVAGTKNTVAANGHTRLMVSHEITLNVCCMHSTLNLPVNTDTATVYAVTFISW